MATGVSIFPQRKQRRHQNLAGRASTHRLPLSLEQSIVENSPAPSSSSSSQQLPSCKRGCPQILTGLKPAFEAPPSRHTKRLASYPVPKKQKVAHRSIKGSYTECMHCILIILNNSLSLIHKDTPYNNYCSSLFFLFLSSLIKLKTNG